MSLAQAPGRFGAAWARPGPWDSCTMTDTYQPLNVKKRVLVVVLALVTAATVLLSMIYRPGSPPPPPHAVAPDAARCAVGQTTDCVGGTAAVIALPASAAPAKAP